MFLRLCNEASIPEKFDNEPEKKAEVLATCHVSQVEDFRGVAGYAAEVRAKAAVVILLLILCSSVGGGIFAGSSPRLCGDEAKGVRDWTGAVRDCRKAYARSQDPEDGLRLARFLQFVDLRDAIIVARQLRSTHVSVGAHEVIGYAAQRLDELEEAQGAYANAFLGYLSTGNRELAVKMANGLAGTMLAFGDVEHADRLANYAVTEAEALKKQEWLVGFHLGIADIYRRRGMPDEAYLEILGAQNARRTEGDHAWFYLKRGIYYISQDDLALAKIDLKKSLGLSEKIGAGDVKVSAALNLAWVERINRNYGKSLEYIEFAEREGSIKIDVYLQRGLTLFDKGDFEPALSEFEMAQKEEPKGEWSWLVPYYSGCALEKLGHLEQAKKTLLVANDAVQSLVERAGNYSPEIAAAHRRSYQRLLGLYAKDKDWKQVLSQVMTLDALSLLASEKRPSNIDLGSGFVRKLDPPPVRRVPDAASVLHAWAARRLLIFVSDEETMWRIEVYKGKLKGTPLGLATEIEELSDLLHVEPSNDAAARILGERLMQGSDEWTAGEVVSVLSIGQLSKIPLSLLKRDDVLISERTPLARVLAVLPRYQQLNERRGMMVMGDPTNSLSAARDEVLAIGKLLGIRPLLGSQVTPAEFAKANGLKLIHVAAHTEHKSNQASLQLSGGLVGRSEILSLRPAPEIVVLASCGGSAARDSAGWGSLAATFFEAGSNAIIAASQNVDDKTTSFLMTELYRYDVVNNPAQALSNAQQAARKKGIDVREWSAFTVLLAPP